MSINPGGSALRQCFLSRQCRSFGCSSQLEALPKPQGLPQGRTMPSPRGMHSLTARRSQEVTPLLPGCCLIAEIWLQAADAPVLSSEQPLSLSWSELMATIKSSVLKLLHPLLRVESMQLQPFPPHQPLCLHFTTFWKSLHHPPPLPHASSAGQKWLEKQRFRASHSEVPASVRLLSSSCKHK